jgi:hypothetical protein
MAVRQDAAQRIREKMTIGTLLLIIIVAMYFIPEWVADTRHHPQRAAIFRHEYLSWMDVSWVGRGPDLVVNLRHRWQSSRLGSDPVDHCHPAPA